MAYEKQNFKSGQKLKAAQLNHMEEGIVNAVSVTEQTLSEEQKAQARENIGAAPNEGNYELIETITIETAAAVIRTAEPDGTPYNFSAMYFHVLVPSGVAIPSGSHLFYNDENSSAYFVHRWTPEVAATSAPHSFAGRVYRDRGIWFWYLPSGFEVNGGSPLMYDEARTDISDIVNDKMIRKIIFNLNYPVGTVINIYGVRA